MAEACEFYYRSVCITICTRVCNYVTAVALLVNLLNFEYGGAKCGRVMTLQENISVVACS